MLNYNLGCFAEQLVAIAFFRILAVAGAKSSFRFLLADRFENVLLDGLFEEEALCLRLSEAI